MKAHLTALRRFPSGSSTPKQMQTHKRSVFRSRSSVNIHTIILAVIFFMIRLSSHSNSCMAG